jgi:hypothetical protein
MIQASSPDELSDIRGLRICATQARDSALVTASAEEKWPNGWSAAATFDGELSSVTTSCAGKGVVRYTL